LTTLVVLVEAVAAARTEGGDVADIERTAVTPGADPRTEAVQAIGVRQHAHALAPVADVAVDQAVRTRGNRGSQRAGGVQAGDVDAEAVFGVAADDGAGDFQVVVEEVALAADRDAADE